VAAERHADAADLRSDPLRISRRPLAPFELFRAAVECLLEECTGGMLPLALHDGSELGLALRTVDTSNRDLVEAGRPRGFGDDRFDDGDPLETAWRALRAPRRRVGQHGDSAAAHGLGLVEERDD